MSLLNHVQGYRHARYKVPGPIFITYSPQGDRAFEPVSLYDRAAFYYLITSDSTFYLCL